MFKIVLRRTLFLCLIGLIPVGAFSQEFEQAHTLKAGAVGTLERADLEAFLDGILAVQLKDRHIAGAAFAAVKDGRILLSKGYGYADISRREPVSAGRTLFRPGSVSKLITWTAVMQLFERGFLDLNTDVNSYLKEFKIPETFPQPIHLTHLMTHTAGFEEKGTGMSARTAEDLMPMGRFLAEHMPARVRPPGELAAYSNFGTALAGYIVESVSGMPFEAYVERNIFAPLKMDHSTFRQPLPDELKNDMSIGYDFTAGVLTAQEFELIRGQPPAGSMSASAEDMARFMIAHLGGGAFEETRILQEGTVRTMHSRLFAHEDGLDGNAHGFWELTYNGIRTLTHGGDTRLFHSLLVLVPEQNFGFFVSYNSVGGGGGPRMRLMEAVMDRYFPASVDSGDAVTQNRGDLRKFTGSYLRARVNSSSYEKIGSLLSVVKVQSTGEDTILISSGAAPSQWIRIEPLVFQRRGGQDKIVFRENSDGRITHLFLERSPHTACIRLSWHQSPGFHAFLLGVCVFLFLTTLAWPVNALRRKLCRCPAPDRPAPRLPRTLAVSVSVLCLLFLIGMSIFFINPTPLMFGVPLAMKLLLGFPLAAGLLGLGVLFYAAGAWFRRWWTWCDRLHYTSILLALILFLWFLNSWNLLGFRF